MQRNPVARLRRDGDRRGVDARHGRRVGPEREARRQRARGRVVEREPLRALAADGRVGADAVSTLCSFFL